MKSFVAYPSQFQKWLLHEISCKNNYNTSADNITLEKVGMVAGTIVKCSTAAKGFTRVALFRKLIEANRNKKVIAFKKIPKANCSFSSENNSVLNRMDYMDMEVIVEALQKGMNERITFVAGDLNNSIPKYLMDYPELKISLLEIDVDDYHATQTALQFFYPRLVNGGILIFDNYCKKEGSYKAITDYFKFGDVFVNNSFDEKCFLNI